MGTLNVELVRGRNSAVYTDQDYIVLKSGDIMAVHGDTHLNGHVVGELVFSPDPAGNLKLDGGTYSKPYAPRGRGIPEELRVVHRDRSHTFLDDLHVYSSKSIIPETLIHRHIPALPVCELAAYRTPAADYLQRNLAHLKDILGSALNDVTTSVTGSLRLQLSDNHGRAYHDADFVLTGAQTSLQKVYHIFRRHLLVNPGSRLFEHGKSWTVRSRTPSGILCLFFRPPHNRTSFFADVLNSEIVSEKIQVVARVIEDARTLYTPQVVTAEILRSADQLPEHCPTEIPLIISHLRSRGELSKGAVGQFTGALILLHKTDHSTMALSVVDGTSSTLVNPPWEPY